MPRDGARGADARHQEDVASTQSTSEPRGKRMTRLQKRLRIAGVLVALGLLCELGSLFWHRPLSFFLFLLVGGGFLVLGVAVYLYALVSVREEDPSAAA